VRVYLPATLDALRTLARDGVWSPGRPGHTVTAGLRHADPDGDRDSWEFEAFCDAAVASLRLLLARPDAAPDRRVVVSADVDDAGVQPAAEPTVASAVTVQRAVHLDDVAAVHLDGQEATELLRRARAGETGQTLAEEALSEVALEWYDPSELDVVLRRTGHTP